MRELIELRENKRFFDNETGPLLRSFFPKSRLLVYCDGTLLGRESTDEKAERETVKPSAVLSINYCIFSMMGNRTRSLVPLRKML